WNRQAKRLGGLHVDDQLEFGCLLDRKIGWLCALQNIFGPALYAVSSLHKGSKIICFPVRLAAPELIQIHEHVRLTLLELQQRFEVTMQRISGELFIVTRGGVGCR